MSVTRIILPGRCGVPIAFCECPEEGTSCSESYAHMIKEMEQMKKRKIQREILGAEIKDGELVINTSGIQHMRSI